MRRIDETGPLQIGDLFIAPSTRTVDNTQLLGL